MKAAGEARLCHKHETITHTKTDQKTTRRAMSRSRPTREALCVKGLPICSILRTTYKARAPHHFTASGEIGLSSTSLSISHTHSCLCLRQYAATQNCSSKDKFSRLSHPPSFNPLFHQVFCRSLSAVVAVAVARPTHKLQSRHASKCVSVLSPC